MTRRDVAELVVRMAVENPTWGYTRIRGALANLGHEFARITVKRTLHDHGIDAAPEGSRRMPWKTFLQAHWDGLLGLSGEQLSHGRGRSRDAPAPHRRVSCSNQTHEYFQSCLPSCESQDQTSGFRHC